VTVRDGAVHGLKLLPWRAGARSHLGAPAITRNAKKNGSRKFDRMPTLSDVSWRRRKQVLGGFQASPLAQGRPSTQVQTSQIALARCPRINSHVPPEGDDAAAVSRSDTAAGVREKVAGERRPSQTIWLRTRELAISSTCCCSPSVSPLRSSGYRKSHRNGFAEYGDERARWRSAGFSRENGRTARRRTRAGRGSDAPKVLERESDRSSACLSRFPVNCRKAWKEPCRFAFP